jgi:ribose transport system substrate-binding protein
LVLGGTGDNFWVGLRCGVLAAAKAAGATVTVQAPLDGTATEQIPIIDEVTARKPDLLIVSATDATAMQVPIQDAAKAGIKVVFVNSAVNHPGFAVSEVLTNDVVGGAAAFKAIKQLNPHGGKVLVVGSIPGVQNTDNRVKGFAQAAKSDPAFSLVGVQYSKNSAIIAAQIVASALQKNPDIIGIFAVGQITAEGTAAGILETGKQGHVTVVGYDAGATQIASLKYNTVQALIAQEPVTIGKDAVQQGLDALAGKPVEKVIHPPVTIITAKNVNTVGKTAEYPSHC